jgi:hypothetical protein
MMQLPVKVYKQEEDSNLHFVEEGICLVYEPTMIEVKGSKVEPYVSFNFGKYRLHVDTKDFRKLLEEFQYNHNSRSSNVSLLRPHL